jgi:PST family polysaccharide transporter
MRRISDLAKMTILGAAFGTAISIPLVYFFRENGIVPSLVAVAGMSIVTSWWYSKKISVEPVRLTPSEVRREVSPLLKLGFAFMASSVMMMGSAYVVRIIILRHLGFEATGLYQAAWTLGGLYVGIVLQAMGADFYPRLTASARDNVACNRLVNEQARIGLLLAGAGVMVTLTFAPAVIWLFYTAKFRAAVEILRWISLGTALQVITWPMGYIILAKGKQKAFFWSEVAWTAVYLSLTWACVRSFGLMGAGLAFFGSYVFHALLIYPIVHCLSGFRWTDENKRTGTLLLTLTVIVFAGFYLFGFWIAVSVGVCVSIFSALYSVRVLLKLFPMDRIPDPLRLVLVKLRLAPSV